MVRVTSDGIKKLSCDRLPASRERLQVGLMYCIAIWNKRKNNWHGALL